MIRRINPLRPVRATACVLGLLSTHVFAAPTTMPIPGQGWQIEFDGPVLTKRRESNGPGQYMYLGNAGRFNLSLYVESPQ